MLIIKPLYIGVQYQTLFDDPNDFDICFEIEREHKPNA